MKELYIWEVTTILDSNMTSTAYPKTFKVVTDDKSFSKAESTAIAHISALMRTTDYSNRKWCGYLTSVEYVDSAMMITMEEIDGQQI